MKDAFLPRTPQDRMIHLMEEMSELGIELAKALRFGLSNHHPDEPSTTNAQRIAREAKDVVTALDRVMCDVYRMLGENDLNDPELFNLLCMIAKNNEVPLLVKVIKPDLTSVSIRDREYSGRTFREAALQYLRHEDL